MKDGHLSAIIRPILKSIGYYKMKATVKMHFYLRRLRKEDGAKRKQIDETIQLLPKNILRRENELVVSLTSYSQRIYNSLPYTLFSLLTQDVLPGRVAVFLSKYELDAQTLPAILRKLQDCGVEFYFVEDTKSYKKLIPAILMFPDNPILTVDDDMYYNKSFIKSFINAYHKSDKHTVLGTIGRMVTRDENGQLKPYSEWENPNEENVKTMAISFYGVGGCLYPPHIFDDEVLNEYVFTKLAPYADDLWFWIMEQRCGVKTQLIDGYKQNLYVPVDRTTWFELDRPDCLTSMNDGKNRNDVQLKALIEYYELH